ncbi:MAG: efflux RND transporter permease subunit, partial [Elusimicrobia bacterium]|nr:efflux RND transporter permease subunit [Elusimicrobiota bacterium]
MAEKLLVRLFGARGAVAVCCLAICVGGLFLARGLHVGLFPPLNFPTLNVITEMPSFSSLEMERQVTFPIESAAGGVLGVSGVRSVSGTGISMVSVQFPWGTDMLQARQLLLQALAAGAGQLPPGAQPSVENLSATLALIEGYAVQGGDDPVALRDRMVYDLKPRLQRVQGVYKVRVLGGQMLEYAVQPNPYLLIKYGLTLDDLRTALADDNILASPGVVNDHDQELVIHTNGQFAGPEEVADTVVAVKEGVPVRVRDLARVKSEYAYQRGDSSENGEPAIFVEVTKQPEFDTSSVANGVARVMADFQKSLPPAYTVKNYYDQAQLVNDSVASVRETVWIGAVLVVLVMAFFLRDLRTTVIATLSIPLSVLAAVILMRLAGIGLDIMSLGGLAIGTAIIVDNSIIVIENIHRWRSTPALTQGLSHRQVVARATAEVSTAVFVSTLTNIAIFLPMVFVSGLAGRLFAPVSGTVTFALLASLIVAVTVIPVLADMWLDRPEEHAEEEGEGRVYPRLLGLVLRSPLPWVLAGVASVALAVWPFQHLDSSFLPDLDEGAVLLNTLMPPGTSIKEAERLNRKLEAWAQKLPGVVVVARRTGHAPGAEDTDN